MKRLPLIAILLATAACGAAVQDNASTANTAADLSAQTDKLAEVRMDVDTSFLSDEERQVVNLLIQASNLMSEIYKRQRAENYDALRGQVEATGDARMLAMFDRNFGPWDEVDDLRAFFGEGAMPEGAGFYPADLTREAFDAYLTANPAEREALTSPYTVVRRQGDRLVAIPYSQAYRQWLEPAAQLLEQAAATTSNASLKRFLTLRAQAFRTDDYFESELAWMDLAGTPIEIAIGPYEVYTDRLMGTKTAFESFLTLKDPQESAALDKYKNYLRDMEANLPVEERYKNFSRGFESPIAVAEQIRGGGDNVPGVQTIAFNLPNDERVREAKGAKKVILSNVLGAKFDRILAPMADQVLIAEQADHVVKKYMQLGTLMHELSHSLGPGTITVGGRQTTVSEALRDQASALEEAKADVMGVHNIVFMMEKGEIPDSEKPQLFATHFAGLFRAMRFGTESAHGHGAAMQFGYLRAKGAFAWDEAAGRYRIDVARMEAANRELLGDIIRLQGNGDYAGVRAFFERWAVLDEPAKRIIAGMNSIPVDILPVYPERV